MEREGETEKEEDGREQAGLGYAIPLQVLGMKNISKEISTCGPHTLALSSSDENLSSPAQYLEKTFFALDSNCSLRRE